jgi:hypothetical protein
MTTAEYERAQESYPPSVFPAPAPPATGATAGVPGSWTPAGSRAPASVTDLAAGTPNPVVASPATAWTSGQFVQTRTAGATGRASWSGSSWVGGAAPLDEPEEPPADTPDTPTEPVPDSY